MQQDLKHRAAIETVPDAPTEPDAFLRWAAGRPREEGRYELSHGVVTRAMINVTRRHATICTNIVIALGRVLDLERYLITSADFAVRTPFGVRGPDILVEPISDDAKALASDQPLLLGEILSPSTEKLDFSRKRDDYLAIPSLQTYMICAADEPCVWVWRRRRDKRWPTKPRQLVRREDEIALGGLDVRLSLAAIYRGIP